MKKTEQSELKTRMQLKKLYSMKKVFFWTGIIFSLLVLIWWRLGTWHKNQILKTAKSEVHRELTLYGYVLTTEINKYLAMVDGLAAFADSQIESGKNISPDEFNLFANGLYQSSKVIRNFSIAPGGIQEYVFPLNKNRPVPQHNLI